MARSFSLAASHAQQTRPPRRVCLLVLLAACVSPGCALLSTDRWSTPNEAPPLDTPAPPAAVRTIQLETRWVRHPVDDPLVVEELWSSVDEQGLPRDVRERLAANGLRVGVVSWPLPSDLAERCAYLEETTEATTAPELEPDDTLMPEVSRQTLRLLPGRHSEVVATPATAEMVVMRRDDGRLCGSTYQQASAVFELTAEAAADGKTSIELLPVIKHGDLRREWIGEEGVFRLEAGQCREDFEPLAVTLDLAADAVFVITAAGPPSSTVGDAFFRGRDLPRTPQQTLLIRPLARTTDPVFSLSGDASTPPTP